MKGLCPLSICVVSASPKNTFPPLTQKGLTQIREYPPQARSIIPYLFGMLPRVQFSRLNAMSKNVIVKGSVRVKEDVPKD